MWIKVLGCYHTPSLALCLYGLTVSVRSWPKAEAQVTFFSVSFGEILWFWKEKFSNLGFDGKSRESRPPNTDHQRQLSTDTVEKL
jgi:hypothetical protein